MSPAGDPQATETPGPTDAQRVAARALADGSTVAHAAVAAGVSKRTVVRWRRDPRFIALVGANDPGARASESTKIRAALWRIANTGPGTARVQALRALAQLEQEGEQRAIDWSAVDVDSIAPEDRDRLLGRLAQLEARDRSTSQLLVARCTGLEVDASTAELAAAAWSKPDPALLEAIGQLGVVAALEQHARGLEQHARGLEHQARDRDRPQASR